jgi:hypothetical protein
LWIAGSEPSDQFGKWVGGIAHDHALRRFSTDAAAAAPQQVCQITG